MAEWRERKTRQHVVLTTIILIFFLGMLPLVATRVIDTMNFERYYTDAAISMLHCAYGGAHSAD